MRERYDWTDEELKQEWELAKTNPLAVWAKDDYGVPVVSLLKTVNANNARKLSNETGVSRARTLDTDDLEGAFSRALSISLCLPDFLPDPQIHINLLHLTSKYCIVNTVSVSFAQVQSREVNCSKKHGPLTFLVRCLFLLGLVLTL